MPANDNPKGTPKDYIPRIARRLGPLGAGFAAGWYVGDFLWNNLYKPHYPTSKPYTMFQGYRMTASCAVRDYTNPGSTCPKKIWYEATSGGLDCNGHTDGTGICRSPANIYPTSSPNTIRETIWHDYGPPGSSNTRFEAWTATWVKTGTHTQVPVHRHGSPAILFVPPTIHPGDLPIKKPVPLPKPLPWKRVTAPPGTQPAYKPKHDEVPPKKRPPFPRPDRVRWPIPWHDDDTETEWGSPPPWIEPGELYDDGPLDDPYTDPSTAPRRRLRPGTRPGTSPGVRPRPRVRTKPRPSYPPVVIAPPRVPSPIIGAPPSVVMPPDVRIETSPNRPPVRTTAPPSATNSPPKKGTKERKLNIRTVAGGAWAVVGFVTETNDFVNVLWDSLPKDCKTPKPKNTKKKMGVGMHEKMEDLYRCWDHADLALAVTNYINNQFEDWFYGQLGMATGKANKNLNQTTGLGRAIRNAGASQTKKQAEKFGSDFVSDDTPLLPVLDYDRETGDWGLKWELLGYEQKLGKQEELNAAKLKKYMEGD